MTKTSMRPPFWAHCPSSLYSLVFPQEEVVIPSLTQDLGVSKPSKMTWLLRFGFCFLNFLTREDDTKISRALNVTREVVFLKLHFMQLFSADASMFLKIRKKLILPPHTWKICPLKLLIIPLDHEFLSSKFLLCATETSSLKVLNFAGWKNS